MNVRLQLIRTQVHLFSVPINSEHPFTFQALDAREYYIVTWNAFNTMVQVRDKRGEKQWSPATPEMLVWSSEWREL